MKKLVLFFAMLWAGFANAQSITIIQPNGGEVLYACQAYTVKWSQTGSPSNYWNIDYSLDGGTIWTSVTSNYLSTNGQFVWTVPHVQSSTVLMRVKDALNSSTIDQSDAFFTINIPITLTSPNGGETWQGGTVHNITWNSVGTSNTFTLRYSTDNGSTWNTIVNNYSTASGTYAWTVPVIPPSTTCLVQVYDYLASCTADQSDAVFTYVPPTPLIQMPNGGETLYMNCSANIFWDPSTFFSNVDLYYSLNNGSTWTMIVSNTPNDGGQLWTVPITPSNTCLIKAANTASPSVYDVSDATFTIAPVHLVSPNGGQTLTGCNTYTYTWTKSPCIGGWNLYYSTDNGATWTQMLYNLTDNGQATQTVSVQMPANVSSTQGLFKISSYNYPAQADVSDATFTFTPSHDITLTYPTGGQTLAGGSTAVITWTTTGNTSGQYELVYNDGSTNTFIGPVTGTSYTWTVPNVNPTKTNCTFQIWDNVNSCKRDISTTFTVTYVPPTPILLTPNGGETLNMNCSANISWNTSTFFSNVDLYYSLNNGSTWTTIVTNTPNDGSQPWTVPISPSNTCLIKAANTASASVYDVSDATFTIAPVHLVSPNGGENLVGCTNYTITWTKSPCMGNWQLSFSTDNGATWNAYSTIPDNGLATQSYNYPVPSNVPSTQALFRVVSANYPAQNDVSDATFTITPSHDITLTYPTGGQNLMGGSTAVITWTTTGNTSGQYELVYNDGSTNTFIGPVTGTSYTWTVPNVNPTKTNCTFQIWDNVNSCKRDISTTFTVTYVPPVPMLLTPNGGESLYAGTSYNISWNTSSFYSTLNLYYSLDNGVTWTTIVTNTPNDGSQAWTVPTTASTLCLVKAANYADPTIYDVSDAVFTIKPPVTVLTPNGDNGVTVWGGCTVTSITFDHSPAWSNYKIEYSLNNGTTWNTIISSFAVSTNPATYNWTLPNYPTSQALVRVSPVSVAYSDQSDATFTITKPVTIIQPNFGGIMQAGTVYPIKWQSDGISNIYDIFYSTNGGATYTTIITGYNTSINTYSWTVPATVSNNCRIIVRDNINTCKTDTSDQAFIIQGTPPGITLLTPNGQDTLKGCSTYNITWNDAPAVGPYNIQYSINSGTSWTNIVTNYSTATHNYSWLVPNTINSQNVLVKVMSTATTTVFDESDALLRIVNGKLLATPHSTAICSGGSVQINSSGGTNYNWSPATALSAANIANPVASPTANITYTVQSNNSGCILQDTVHISVSPAGAVAGITITASPSNTVCPGTLVTFTGATANGGTTPGYQWTLNGSPVSTNATYTTNTINNNDVITCTMTSTLGCVVNPTVTSNAISMSVVSSVSPSVAITASPSNTICTGATVTFSAMPSFGGTTPAYQWKKNSTNVATTSTYTSNTLVNGDVITVVMTSNAACVSTTTATSNAITIATMSTPATPAAISGSTAVCANGGYTYSVAPVAGATAYNWTLPTGWTGTSSSNTIAVTSYTANGTMSVSASNACGTSATKTLAVTISTLAVSVSGPTVVCSGSPATLTASGASTYSWSTSQATSSITVNPLVPTTYTVTGTNAAGCSNTAVKTVSVNALPNVSASSATICAGNTASLSAAGASTYSWSTGATTASITVSPGSTAVYTVTGTSSVSCVNTATAMVTVNSLPTVAASSATICAGDAASLTASGASTYSWSTGANTASISVSPSSNASYTVTGIDGNGCSKTATAMVNVNAAPPVTASSFTICPSAVATLTASGASTYTWSTGQSGSTLTVSPGSTTAYTVTGSSAAGCTNTAVGTVSVASLPTVAASSATICAGNVASLTASGASTYTWSTGQSGGSISVSPASGTSYTVAGTSSAGCTNTAIAMVSVNSLPAVTASSATICAGNAASLTASGANTYTWSTGANTMSISVSPSNSTSYTVTGTDGNSCVNTMTTLVNVNAAPPVAASSATICAGSTATLTASGASTYTWSNTDVGNATIVSPAADAAYTVTGTDANGCMAMATGSVSIAPDPSLTVNSPTICAGSTATLTVSGANTYTWSTGTTGSTETVSPSANTDYTVTGTSMFGCSNTATTTVVVGSAPAITVNSATVCAGSQATLSASGVNSYSWSTGANTAVIQVSPSATAVYTVTGSLTGCSTQASNTATVTVNSLPTVSVSASASLVCAGQPVSLTASGTATSYSWSSGSVTNTESVSPSGTTTYTVTGTDGNSCSQDAAITITVTTCTGIEAALAATGQIIVYPNPASDYVTVESSESLQSVSLVDMLGKTVLKVTGINKQSISLDLQTYEPGVYFVEVRTGTSTRQVKIVKR